MVALAPVSLTASSTVSKTGTPSTFSHRLAWRYPADHLGAVLFATTRMKLSRLASDTLADDSCIAINKSS